MESAVNTNGQAHDNMSASHGRCENGKVNEKHKGQGVVYQNNHLNINLMHSRCLCTFVQQTVRLLLKIQYLVKLKFLYVVVKELYAVMQLCSFFMRGVKRGEKKFYYIYNNYIFSKKSNQEWQVGKK